ncbi:MAG: family 65 glycosyl hydrolase [Christensenellaceae bacterium]|jgi:maltose phosphorylase|nr:family 65 glycosyl hydrolase [Christensenellaceae bacterium]
MAKTPIKYYKVDPWSIIEEGYNPERNQVSESVFSLANEYSGVRGFIEEGVSAQTLVGTYFNGIYENSKTVNETAYKGIIKRGHFMVNSVNWLKTAIVIGGETLDVAKNDIEGFKRTLDFKSGLLTREFVWKADCAEIKVKFERFLSMSEKERGYQSITLEADKDITAEVSLSLDFNILHWGADCYFTQEEFIKGQNSFGISAKTLTTNQRVSSALSFSVSRDCEVEISNTPRLATAVLKIDLQRNTPVIITRSVANIAEKVADGDGLKELEQARALAKKGNFDIDLEKNKAYWARFWDESDIEIDGSPEDQQGIRFCLFQLQQTYQGRDPKDNIGAKGLTGEAYSGHAFWDTETCCLPFYLFNNVKAAKDLLLFRYNTLRQAKERAKMLDCQGACYPIATLNGNEACDLWQHASTQFQPSTAVAYGIEHFIKVTGDTKFLYAYGAEMLVEISRFLATRGQWNQDNTRFGFYGVMGPDEFQIMVNQNCYTNFMAKKSFAYTLSVLKDFKKSKPQEYAEFAARMSLSPEELSNFKACADKMLILYSPKTKLFEQHDGFFKLPHIDVDAIPDTDFPLYYHWSYDRIYRNDMIKQADVLMFMFLYPQDFSKEQLLANYEYYEPRCIHESSLSPSVHSVIAADLGKTAEAANFFAFATRMDLDDYNRNTREGLHVTSIASAWLNIVYGFGGLKSDRMTVSIEPSLPEIWQGYKFSVTVKGQTVTVSVKKDGVTIQNNGKKAVVLRVYCKKIKIDCGRQIKVNGGIIYEV